LLSGVGTGLDLPYLPDGHRYVATDLVPAMLARARSRQEKLNIAWARADSMRLPFAAERFDVVVLHLIVAVVAHPVAVLAEAARVTRTDGMVLVLDKFLESGRHAPVRRWLSPFAARIATRLDVVFEDVLAEVPQLAVLQDEPALAGGWFRHLVLRKRLAAVRAGTQRFSPESRS
jgi:ubiquinone/menaquinone biosynthesis C-methylase UbiE